MTLHFFYMTKQQHFLLGLKMNEVVALRCDACLKIQNGVRPDDCERIVQYTCAGPKLPQVPDLMKRVRELEEQLRTVKHKKIMKLCPCGGQHIIGTEC